MSTNNDWKPDSVTFVNDKGEQRTYPKEDLAVYAGAKEAAAFGKPVPMVSPHEDERYWENAFDRPVEPFPHTEDFVNVRMDELTLGDRVLLPDVMADTCSCVRVTTLTLGGDDVTVNGKFAASISNKVTIVARTKGES